MEFTDLIEAQVKLRRQLAKILPLRDDDIEADNKEKIAENRREHYRQIEKDMS
jgi:hypothetical protein